MGRTSQAKTNEEHVMGSTEQGGIAEKVRLDLNDLIKKRQEEKRVDKKANLVILSGVAAVTVVILAMLTL